MNLEKKERAIESPAIEEYVVATLSPDEVQEIIKDHLIARGYEVVECFALTHHEIARDVWGMGGHTISFFDGFKAEVKEAPHDDE